jgi:4-carboxymuconolactone decarboxylase
MNDARFPRLTEESMSREQRQVAAEISAGPRGEVRGPFIPLLHHPELARRIQQLGEQLRWKGTLPPALTELAVLVTARRWTCQHEWLVHEKLARQAGVSPSLIDDLQQGRQPSAMTADEAAVYAFCKEAHATGCVEERTFLNIKNKFGLEGAVELLVLCGYYSMMAMVLNTAAMALPNNAPPPLV